MPLIKNAAADSIISSAVVPNVGDLRRQADRLLAEAREEHDRIIEEAKRAAERIIAEAAPAGHAEGLQRGLEEGRTHGRREAFEQYDATLRGLIQSWTEALDSWAADRRKMLLEAREDVLCFAIEMGRSIVHRAIEADPSRVVDQVAAALQLVREPSALVIEVNPDDRACVDEALGDILRSIAHDADASLVDSTDVDRGGCVIRTRGGMIDARIGTQIRRIVATLLPSDTDGAARSSRIPAEHVDDDDECAPNDMEPAS